MIKINNNYLNIKDNYLFAKIAEEKRNYIKSHESTSLIDLSIGDVTLPLTPSICNGTINAIKKLSNKDTFTGYPPSSGHDFLKEQIIQKDYLKKDIQIKKNELFISDSSKSDISNILDIFESGITVALQDPVYPAYIDSNMLRGNNIVYYENILDLIQNIKNQKLSIDILYICSPNNPTGSVIYKENLETIINLAKEYNFLIFFDGAYEAFITQNDTIHSVYEVDGAMDVAIEFRSFSKTAGYTPVRLSYTIIPDKIIVNNTCINALFKRLKDTKYNGPSYISEYGIYNLYKENKFNEINFNIEYYLENTKLLLEFFKSKNLVDTTISKVNSPYVWINTPNNIKSWDFFYELLNNYSIVGTPGVGFGKNGEHHFRFTGFNTKENTLKAIERMKDL